MAAADVPAERRKRPIAGIGRVIVWPGASLWIGRDVGDVAEHAHHAIQISLALEGRFRIQSDAWPDWRETAAAVVMPDRRHRFDGCKTAVAMLFVEPNSTPGAALRKRFAGHGVALLGDAEAEAAVSALREQFLAQAPDGPLARYAMGAICRIAGDPLSAPRTDARITAGLDWMQRNLATPMRLQDVAAVVHLSPGRFRHLFVAQTGTSFRAWLLWARAQAAIAAATRGASWTDAAQDAGFADAAHFTRTCRRVFGIAPTMLVFDQARERHPRGQDGSESPA
jgi:AraC-like DNA-binding protein